MKFFATLLLCLSASSAFAQYGYLDATSSIQTQLNGKQGTLTLTTTGTSGAATLVGNTLNIPAYSGSIGGLTAGYIPQATSGTAIGNSFIDYGVTTAGVYTSTKEIDGTVFKWNGGGTIGGGQDWVEGTAPTGVAGDDLIYALAANHRIQMKLNAGSALNIPGIATAGTSGNCVKLAANGIDLVDNGSVCATGGGGVTGSTNQVVRMSATNVAAGSSAFTDNGSDTLTYGAANTATQTAFILGNVANTHGVQLRLKSYVNSGVNPICIETQFTSGACSFYVDQNAYVTASGARVWGGVPNLTDTTLPVIPYSRHFVTQTAALTTTYVRDSNNADANSNVPGGLYQLCGHLRVTTVGTGTLTLTVSYNNGAARTLPVTLSSTALYGENSVCVMRTQLAANSSISFVTSGVAGSVGYSVDVDVQRVN